MHSNKFICEKVVKRGREWGGGALRLSAQQEVKISLNGKREVSRWPTSRRWGGGLLKPLIHPCGIHDLELVKLGGSRWKGGGWLRGWKGGGYM